MRDAFASPSEAGAIIDKYHKEISPEVGTGETELVKELAILPDRPLGAIDEEHLKQTIDIVAAMAKEWAPELLYNTYVTLRETIIGFVLALVLSLLLAVIIAFTSTARRLLYPILLGLQSVPKVALAPLVIMPHLFTGCMIVITLAVIGAVIGEFVAAQEGLGT